MLPLLGAGQPATPALLTSVLNDLAAAPQRGRARARRLPPRRRPRGGRGHDVPARPPPSEPARGARHARRSAAPSVAAARPRRARRDPRARPALHRRRDRGVPRGRARPRRRARRRRSPRVAHRGLGRRAAARRAVDAGTRRRRRVRLGVRRHRPARRRLPRRRGALAPDRRRARLPHPHLGSRPALRRPLRRRARDAPAAAAVLERSTGRTSSSCRSTTSAGGTATTTCSPTSCSAHLRAEHAAEPSPALHAAREPLVRRCAGSPCPPCGTRSRRATLDRAADLVETATPGLRRRRQEATLRRWIDDFPDDVVHRRPVLALGVRRRADVVQRVRRSRAAACDDSSAQLPAIERRIADGRPGRAERSSSRSTHSSSRACPARSSSTAPGWRWWPATSPARTAHAALAIDAAPPDDDVVRAGAAGLSGLAHWAGGDARRRVRRLRRVHRRPAPRAARVGRDRLLPHARRDPCGAGQAARRRRPSYDDALALAAGTADQPVRGAADIHVGAGRAGARPGRPRHRAHGSSTTARSLGEELGLPRYAVPLARRRGDARRGRGRPRRRARPPARCGAGLPRRLLARRPPAARLGRPAAAAARRPRRRGALGAATTASMLARTCRTSASSST